MLIHNQGAAQRNHHQNAEQAAEDRHQHDAREFEIESENHDRRHGHAKAERDRFARGTGSLHNVVFQNVRVAQTHCGEKSKERDRNHRDRNRSAYRQSDFENEIKRRSAENHSQQSSDDQGKRREFPKVH